MRKRPQFTTTLKKRTLDQLQEIATAFGRNRNEVIEVLVSTFYSRSFQKALKDYPGTQTKRNQQ